MLNSSTARRTVLASQAVAHAGFNRRRAHTASTSVDLRQSDGDYLLGGVDVPVVHHSARGTSPLPNIERHGLVLESTIGSRAELARRIEAVNADECPPMPRALGLQHANQFTPAGIDRKSVV